MKTHSALCAPLLLSLASIAAAGGCSSAPTSEAVKSTSSADTGSATGGFFSFGGQYDYGNRCLDIKGDNIAETESFDSAACTGGLGQSFVIDGTQIHPAQNLGYCLDIQGANYSPGVWIQLWPCNQLPNQQWTFVNGAIHAQAAPTMCLDVIGGNTASGAPVGIEDCNGSLEQLWFPFGFTQEMESTEKSGALSECLDVWQNGSTAGTTVDDYICDVNSDRNPAQVFTLTAQHQIMDHGLCLGIVPGTATSLEMLACNDSLQQEWQYAPGPNNTLEIQSSYGFFPCLTVSGNSPASGTTVDLAACGQPTSQEWSPTLTGTPCGGSSEVCCTNPAESLCDTGYNCVQNSCTQCGTVAGQACCSTGAACGTGLECQSGTCETPPAPPPPCTLQAPSCSISSVGIVKSTAFGGTWAYQVAFNYNTGMCSTDTETLNVDPFYVPNQTPGSAFQQNISNVAVGNHTYTFDYPGTPEPMANGTWDIQINGTGSNNRSCLIVDAFTVELSGSTGSIKTGG